MDLISSNYASYHELDCSKLKTVEDIVKVLEGLQIAFQKGSRAYEMLKPFLKDLPRD